MRILVYRWRSLTNFDIEEELQRMRVEFDVFDDDCDLSVFHDDKFVEIVREYLRRKSYDAVFTVNYFTPIAEACQDAGVLYISWSYDSPMRIETSKGLFFDTTKIFSFDALEVEEIKKKYGITNVWHLPLAVSTRRFDRYIPSSAERKRYKSEISFIGQLYDNGLYYDLQHVPEYWREYIRSLTDVQLDTYGMDIMRPALSEEVLKAVSTQDFMDAVGNAVYLKGESRPKVIQELFLWIWMCRNVTFRERLMILELLGKHFPVRFFSYQKSEILKNVEQCGQVDWFEEMPKVFKCSRINLNISVRKIVSAIPQRCLDIMGCGGFLLSNFQPELAELVPDDACVMYESVLDAYEKAQYYLEHEDERKKISMRGYEVMKKDFTYRSRLETMFRITGLMK
ncbi:Glycosyl transferases group 1 [Lachnospiraceae bacterium]|nr:Glycosyl transferases group 1 [Lachnospiraceae bacterium]